MSPKLTKPELRFFQEEETFCTEFGSVRNVPKAMRIAMSLQSSAAAYLFGGYLGVRKPNKKKALKLHLKACQFYPQIIENCLEFRKELNKKVLCN